MMTGLLMAAALLAPQDPDARPAGEAEAIEATLVSFTGTVDVKRPDDADWIGAERNMKLPKGSEICTAMSSSATLLFTGQIQVDVRALTQASIEELAKVDEQVEADLELKFGTIEVDIRKGDLKADMKVASPHSTTSVSGSRGVIRAPASGPGRLVTLRCFTGVWIRNSEGRGIYYVLHSPGVTNDFAEIRRDLVYRDSTRLFLDYFGQDESELYQDFFSVKGGDFHPSLVPLYERGGGQNPIIGVFQKPGGLFLPPPPPASP